MLPPLPNPPPNPPIPDPSPPNPPIGIGMFVGALPIKLGLLDDGSINCYPKTFGGKIFGLL